MNLKLFVHLYKKSPFPFGNEWIIPTCFERNLDIGGNYICLNDTQPNISELLPKNESIDEYRVGYLAQTIAVEYWILKHIHDLDYVGVTGYRRYPLFNFNPELTAPVISIEANNESLQTIANQTQIDHAKNILQVYDAITPRSIYFTGSVREQFIESQPKEIWELFLECINEVTPEFSNRIKWFDIEKNSIYFGPMGMTPLKIFKEYADSYSKIVSLMCQRASNPFILNDESTRMKTDRWIGYLAERYYPFFLFCNKITTYQVPTLFLR